jgi:hypothetical protein
MSTTEETFFGSNIERGIEGPAVAVPPRTTPRTTPLPPPLPGVTDRTVAAIFDKVEPGDNGTPEPPDGLVETPLPVDPGAVTVTTRVERTTTGTATTVTTVVAFGAGTAASGCQDS